MKKIHLAEERATVGMPRSWRSTI